MSLFGSILSQTVRNLKVTHNLNVTQPASAVMNGTLDLENILEGKINDTERNPIFNVDMTGSGGFALSYNYATGTTGYIGGLYYAPSHQQFVLFSNASGSQFSNLDNVTFNPSNFASLNLGNLYSNTVSLVSNSGTGSISQTGSNGVYIPDLVVNNITGTNGFFQNMVFRILQMLIY